MKGCILNKPPHKEERKLRAQIISSFHICRMKKVYIHSPLSLQTKGTSNYANHSIEKNHIGTEFFSTVDETLIILTREKGNQENKWQWSMKIDLHTNLKTHITNSMCSEEHRLASVE